MPRTYFKKIEADYLKQDFEYVIGVDEVGRGPLAGPMVLGLVVYNPNILKLRGLNDSKKLSEKKRIELEVKILNLAKTSIGIVSAQEIDELGLTAATELAIDRGLNDLNKEFDLSKALILMDGKYKYKTTYGEVEAIIKGDSKVRVIAAASIIAKVFRDKLMQEYAKLYPAYRFERNVGYGTQIHREAIQEVGICPIHRKSFLNKIHAA